jgi:hypothetical protein
VKADQLPSLRPLITVWLDIAISAIMSLSPDRARRLYCVIDELPSLQKLPSLSDFLARARKYGGCGILGYQSYPQLEATYGIQDAAAITGYCSTWVALRANDTPTAKHVSENLGQVEQVEANEGMSYGVNDMRDGVNLSRMQVTRPLVMHTEVTNLPNLAGFLRFGRNLPVVRFQDSFNTVPVAGAAFMERSAPPIRLDEESDKSAAPAPLVDVQCPKGSPSSRARSLSRFRQPADRSDREYRHSAGASQDRGTGFSRGRAFAGQAARTVRRTCGPRLRHQPCQRADEEAWVRCHPSPPPRSCGGYESQPPGRYCEWSNRSKKAAGRCTFVANRKSVV